MEELTSALSSYAQGFQQSFDEVFDKVGASLAQSQHMMKMMNEMMEMALLQNVQIAWKVTNPLVLSVTVANRSRVLIEHAVIEIKQAGSERTCSHEINQLLPLSSQTASFQLQATVFQAIAGVIRVSFPSPGTKKPMTQAAPYEISCLHLCRAEQVRVHTAGPSTKSDRCEGVIAADLLREQLDLTPYDGLLLLPDGFYRLVPFSAKELRLALFVSQDLEERGLCRVQVAADSEEANAAFSSFVAAFSKDFASKKVAKP